MRKFGLILLTMVVSLSLLASPVLAGQGKAHSGKSSSGSKSKSVRQSNSKVQDKVKSEVKERTEKRVHTRLDNMSAEQKQEIRNKINERKKQVVKREFADTKAHWAQNEIQKVQSLGLINGYQDGTFKPDSLISSAEAMVMSVRLADILDSEDEVTAAEEEDIEAGQEVTETEEEVAEEEENISDVPDWAKDEAKKAAALKIINRNRFHSEVQATRAQAAVMLAKALEIQPVDTTDITFSDSILISPEDVGYILALKEAGIVKGAPDGKFNPNSSITRAEFATMLSRIDDMVENDGTNKDESTTQGIDPTENTEATDQTNETGTDEVNENEQTDQVTEPVEETENTNQTTEGETTNQETESDEGTEVTE